MKVSSNQPFYPLSYSYHQLKNIAQVVIPLLLLYQQFQQVDGGPLAYNACLISCNLAIKLNASISVAASFGNPYTATALSILSAASCPISCGYQLIAPGF